jgi:hypothetical protein
MFCLSPNGGVNQVKCSENVAGIAGKTAIRQAPALTLPLCASPWVAPNNGCGRG